MPCGYDLGAAGRDAAHLRDISAIRDTPAAQNGRVFAVDATAYFSRPGPRLVDGLELLAWALHPDAFPEPPAGRITAVGP